MEGAARAVECGSSLPRGGESRRVLEDWLLEAE